MSAEDDARMVDMKQLMLYAPALATAPFLWGCKCLVTIFFGSIVTNIYETYCNYPLDSFVRGQVALAYTFLMIWGWILIGPLPFKSLKPVFGLYGLLALIQFIWAIIGTAWYRLGRLPCQELVPELTAYANFEIVTFWISFVVAAFYIIRWRIEIYQEQKKHAFLTGSLSKDGGAGDGNDGDYNDEDEVGDGNDQEADSGENEMPAGTGVEAKTKEGSDSDEDDDDGDPF